MQKKQLPNVTLLAMSSVKIWDTVKALRHSMKKIEYGEVVLVSHSKPFYLSNKIHFKKTERINNIDDFNYKMVYDLGQYVDTDYVMIIHYDGFVVHPEEWRDEFLEYDYIGAPWPVNSGDDFKDSKGQVCRVGNSVSLRSKRLLEYPGKAEIPWEPLSSGWFNEDTFLCCKHKNEMEQEGMKWAPLEVAVCFSHETDLPENEGVTSFAFHKFWNQNEQYKKYIHPIKMTLKLIYQAIANKLKEGEGQ